MLEAIIFDMDGLIEDSLNGVLAAKTARMGCFAVPEAYPAHNPKFIIADQVFPSLVEVKTELAAWLEESHKV
ncbi:MAG: hypothetical protein ABEI32_02225 [Halothece sp.]